MATVNTASLRAQLDDCRAQFDAIKRKGEAGADTLTLINALFLLLDILVAVFLEKTTPKTSRNSSLPSSRDDDDGARSAARAGSGAKRPKVREANSDTLRTVILTDASPVTACRQCGHDLSDTACSGHERRIEVDIVFETVERRVEAEIKDCPRCHARNRGPFPDTMPGPLQYGPGIVAYRSPQTTLAYSEVANAMAMDAAERTACRENDTLDLRRSVDTKVLLEDWRCTSW